MRIVDLDVHDPRTALVVGRCNALEIRERLLVTSTEEPSLLRQKQVRTLLKGWKDTRSGFAFVAEQGATLIAFASFELKRKAPDTDESLIAWITIVVFDRKLRRSGVGTAILEYIEKRATERGATAVEAGVFAFNRTARLFFRARSYVETDCVPRVTRWRGRWWSDIRLTKPLGNAIADPKTRDGNLRG